jgi:hypothetical protein
MLVEFFVIFNIFKTSKDRNKKDCASDDRVSYVLLCLLGTVHGQLHCGVLLADIMLQLNSSKIHTVIDGYSWVRETHHG